VDSPRSIPREFVVAVPTVDEVSANVRSILAQTYLQFKQTWLETKAILYFRQPDIFYAGHEIIYIFYL
jgi:hypothetical protein